METLDNDLKINGKGLSFNGAVQGYLKAMSGWAVVISVFVFLVMICQIIVGAYLLWLNIQIEDSIYNAEIKSTYAIVGWLYIAIGGALVFPGLYLIRFSINAKRAFETTDQGDLEFAIRNLRNLFVFAGSYVSLFMLLIVILLFSIFG